MKKTNIIILFLIPIPLFGYWGSYYNIANFRSPSLRLAAMGNFGVIIESELCELNFYDFGQNVAGLVENDGTRTLVRSVGIYNKDKYKPSWNDSYEEEWFTSKKGIVEATWQVSNMAFSLKPLYCQTPYYWYLESMKEQGLSFSYAYKFPWFIIGGEIGGKRNYKKEEEDTITYYEKEWDTKEAKVSAISLSLRLVGGSLCTGVSFECRDNNYEKSEYGYMREIKEKEVSIQAIYLWEAKLKIGLRSEVLEKQDVRKYSNDSQKDTTEMLKATKMKGIYTIGSGEHKINVGFEMEFATPIIWEYFGYPWWTYNGKKFGYGSGLLYSHSKRGCLGIEFLMSKNKLEPYENESSTDRWRSIRVGGELNIIKCFYLRGGYCAESRYYENDWSGYWERSEVYCAGLGVKLLRLKLDLAYNFEEEIFSDGGSYINSHTVGIAVTFYP
ncbi:hypothetical protein KAW50_04685 [candidate division WOR-3 bacterium]|nr:hypothetical protein [candidate division WOR-3 bacterium]